MLRRKYRKMPKNMEEFSRRFGWSIRHVADVVGDCDLHGLRPETANRKAAEDIRGLTLEYLGWFRAEPSKTHVFPLTGAVLQYWFAKGVRDGAGLKTRLRTMATSRNYFRAREMNAMSEQAGKLKLAPGGAVVHDYESEAQHTLSNIRDTVNVPKEKIAFHPLSNKRVHFLGNVPVFGTTVQVQPKFIVGKEFTASGRLNLAPLGGIPKRKIAFIKRAVYAVGVASARELLKEKR